MTTSPSRPIVVGVDRSGSADTALQWAAAEAVRRGSPLRLVHAWHRTLHVSYGALAPPPSGVPGEALRRNGEIVLASAHGQVRRQCPALEVSELLLEGHPAPVLIEQSREALLTVVGRRGSGGFTRLRIGSVPLHLAAHAGSPVAVVPAGTAEPTGASETATDPRVVVGVDGSETSLQAVAYAFAAADRLGARLEVVHAWGAGFDEPLPEGALAESLQEEGRLEVSESIAGYRSDFPDVAVTTQVSRGHPVQALEHASSGAALLVVGSRGRGAFPGMLLGSVSAGVLRHSACPVVVVRP